MDEDELLARLQQGEGPRVEFKRCGNTPERDVYETICSFANHFGGTIFLGVSDSGEVIGVGGEPKEIERNIVNTLNNPNAFSPAPFAETEVIACANANIIRIWVPSGPEVYRYRGNVYSRAADADVQLRSTAQITSIAIRKQQVYTERHIFPFLTMDELNHELLERARTMAESKRHSHPWSSMDNESLLRSANLLVKDPSSGEEGLTRAAALIFGTDETIAAVCPSYRTDAVFMPSTQRRYEDRLMVTTNLMDAFDALVDFCRRHTPDPFFLEGDRAVSIRDVIVREIVTNTLIHREYLSPLTARLIIDPSGIRTENANRAIFDGDITLANLNPTPKNPVIAGFFLQIGLAEELGSGTRTLYRYSRAFMGADPHMHEGDVFTTFVPYAPTPITKQSSNVDQHIVTLLESHGTITSMQVADALGVTSRTASEHLRKLTEAGVVQAEGNTRNRRYRLHT